MQIKNPHKEHETRTENHAKNDGRRVDHTRHHDSYDVQIYLIAMVCMSTPWP